VCRLVDKTIAPSSAFAQCFGDARGAQAERIPMARVVAGDLVLSSPSEATRVVIAQHRADESATPMIVLEHEHGKLVLTADHVLKMDGRFVVARKAVVGAVLEPASKIIRVYTTSRGIVNVITVSGKILAAARTGDPVVATVWTTEWLASRMLSTPYPLPFSSAVSYLFPESAQAFFDAHGETFVDKTVGVRRFTELRAALPTPLALAMVYFGFDIACVVGFAAWAVCSHEGLIALLTLAAAVKARRSLKA
jgi:hypothetical protein